MKAPASRRRLLTFALLGLCAALAVLAFVPPPEAASTGIGRVAATSLGSNDPAQPPLKANRNHGPAFERPIFVPSRRFAAAADGSRASGTAIRGLKLKAVFLGPEAEKAFLTTAGMPDGRWVSVGQTLEGWHVETIRPESVVLTSAGEHHEIELEKPEAAPARRPSRLRRPRPASAAQPERGMQAAPKAENGRQNAEPD